MIEALESSCRTWGYQTRRQWLGGHLDKLTNQFHYDGWPKQSDMAKFKELHDAASSRTQKVSQFNEEGLIGEALLISRAIKTPPVLSEQLYWTMFAKYVLSNDVPVKAKAHAMGVSVREFWTNLDRAHHFIAARLPASAHNVHTPEALCAHR